MGTGASHTSSPSPESRSIETESNCAPGRLVKIGRTGAVATVIIKVGKEEWMNFDENDSDQSYGRLGDTGIEHPLFKGKLVLMADEQEGRSVKQCIPGIPVHVCGQMTEDSITKQLQIWKDQEIHLISLRCEPVYMISPLTCNDESTQEKCSCHLYCSERKIPYTPRGLHITQRDTARDHELNLRKQLVSLAASTGEAYFHYYQTPDSEASPTIMQLDDDLLTLEEQMVDIMDLNPRLQYSRYTFPPAELPDMEVIEIFINSMQSRKSELPRTILLMGQTGDEERCLFASCLAILCVENSSQRSQCHCESTYKSSLLDNVRVIRLLTSQLPQGAERKIEVDNYLDKLTTYDMRKQLDGAIQELCGKKKENADYRHLHQKCVSKLHMYCLLIVCQTYLMDKDSDNIKFRDWLSRHGELLTVLRCTGEIFPLQASTTLGAHCQMIPDHPSITDHLSTKADQGVANLRQIPGMPIYGMAQPSIEGIRNLSEWLHEKRKFNRITLVSLRQEPFLLCDGMSYSLRSNNHLEEPMSLRNISFSELQEISLLLQEQLTDKKMFKQVLTPKEAFSLDSIQFIQMPMAEHQAPTGKVLENIRKLVEDNLTGDHGEDDRAAVIFFCYDGTDRTTTAMAVAGLAYCHLTGFPYGSGKGEAERISVRNAIFTKGEYKVIQNLIASIPHGHQVKREVDFILDQVYENGTMMHYHMREEIFVVHKKKQRAQKMEDKSSYELHKLALDYLERYAKLIIFNAYLKNQRNEDQSYTQWLQSTGAREGYMKLMDNLCFYEFDSPCPLRSRLMRDINKEARHLVDL